MHYLRREFLNPIFLIVQSNLFQYIFLVYMIRSCLCQTYISDDIHKLTNFWREPFVIPKLPNTPPPFFRVPIKPNPLPLYSSASYPRFKSKLPRPIAFISRASHPFARYPLRRYDPYPLPPTLTPCPLARRACAPLPG